MKGVRASIRYAKALMQLAQETKQVDVVIVDAKMIHNLVETSDDFRIFLASPLVRAEQKRNIMSSIFKGKVSDLMLRFLDQIVEQGREGSTQTIMEKFIDLYNEMNNIARVSLTTAAALSASAKKDLLEQLKAKYKFAQIELTETVDPELLGGMLMRMGDTQLDASIRRQLQNIEKELVQA